MFDIYAYVWSHLNAPNVPKMDDIARGSGVPKSTIRWIQNAETSNPRIDTLNKLAKYFEKLEKVKK